MLHLLLNRCVRYRAAPHVRGSGPAVLPGGHGAHRQEEREARQEIFPALCRPQAPVPLSCTLPGRYLGNFFKDFGEKAWV